MFELWPFVCNNRTSAVRCNPEYDGLILVCCSFLLSISRYSYFFVPILLFGSCLLDCILYLSILVFSSIVSVSFVKSGASFILNFILSYRLIVDNKIPWSWFASDIIYFSTSLFNFSTYLRVNDTMLAIAERWYRFCCQLMVGIHVWWWTKIWKVIFLFRIFLFLFVFKVYAYCFILIYEQEGWFITTAMWSIIAFLQRLRRQCLW